MGGGGAHIQNRCVCVGCGGRGSCLDTCNAFCWGVQYIQDIQARSGCARESGAEEVASADFAYCAEESATATVDAGSVYCEHGAVSFLFFSDKFSTVSSGIDASSLQEHHASGHQNGGKSSKSLSLRRKACCNPAYGRVSSFRLCNLCCTGSVHCRSMWSDDVV